MTVNRMYAVEDHSDATTEIHRLAFDGSPIRFYRHDGRIFVNVKDINGAFSVNTYVWLMQRKFRVGVRPTTTGASTEELEYASSEILSAILNYQLERGRTKTGCRAGMLDIMFRGLWQKGGTVHAAAV